MLRLLTGLTEAGFTGVAFTETQMLRGTACRVATARTGSRELMAWLDDQHVRRIRIRKWAFGADPRTAVTVVLDLWDFASPPTPSTGRTCPISRLPSAP